MRAGIGETARSAASGSDVFTHPPPPRDQLEPHTPGAVGSGAGIISGIYWIFGFLRMGTTGLAAQALGRDDRAEVSALLSRALMIAFAAGATIIALQWPIFAGAFSVAPASTEVEALARDYLAIRVWSAPAAIAIYGLTGWLIAQERTAAVLVLQLWMNGVNIALDLWFVLGLGWGVPGVAVATFLAEWSGLALGIWLCRDAFATPAWRDLNFDDRVEMTQGVLKIKGNDHWMERLDAEGVACAPVITRTELIENPQVRASEIIQQSEHPVAGRVRQACHAAQVSATPASVRRQAPGLGENTDEILSEAGVSATEIAQLRAAGIAGEEN